MPVNCFPAKQLTQFYKHLKGDEMSVKRFFDTHLIPRIASQLRYSRNPSNIRNPLIYCVNRFFLIFDVSQVQKPYRASTNGFLTF